MRGFEVSRYVFNSLYDIVRDVLNDFRDFGRQLTHMCMSGHKLSMQDVNKVNAPAEGLAVADMQRVMALMADPFNFHEIQQGARGFYVTCVGGPNQGESMQVGQGPEQGDKPNEPNAPERKNSKRMLQS